MECPEEPILSPLACSVRILLRLIITLIIAFSSRRDAAILRSTSKDTVMQLQHQCYLLRLETAKLCTAAAVLLDLGMKLPRTGTYVHIEILQKA